MPVLIQRSRWRYRIRQIVSGADRVHQGDKPFRRYRAITSGERGSAALAGSDVPRCALRKANRAVALGGEIALQTDDVRREAFAEIEAMLFAVDAEVEDLAFVPFGLEARGNADRAERLHEGEHLQTENAADWRFDECDLHRVLPGKRIVTALISSSAP
jgi:hypothetical protein